MIKIRLLLLLVSISGFSFSQITTVTVSGLIKSKQDKTPVAYANIVLLHEKDSAFATGTVSNDEGRFSITGIKPGSYVLRVSFTGFAIRTQSLFVGELSGFLDIPEIELEQQAAGLMDVTVSASANDISSKLDKKTFTLSDNVSQLGGSVLQSMQSLPGITVQDGKVYLRGSDRVTILIDGKQTALTGFGSQAGLDNLSASAIEKIEIINNPSARYDANGHAGIINIIMKKSRKDGWNGKLGISGGAGALWIRKENLPTIRPQYHLTPKINPSVSLNYRRNKVNVFLQADDLYTETLNKNEFVTRTYDDGTVIHSQLKRNRNTNFLTTKAGADLLLDDQNTVTISSLYGLETIIDRGDQPFFNKGLSQRIRLWQFLEDEVKTTVMAMVAYQHKFKEPGHVLSAGFNYTFHREDEKYFYDNFLPSSKGTDAFALISDEQVQDLNVDYVKPLRYGRIETGVRFRYRTIPTNMNFIPGTNSVLDSNAGGWAIYKELIPALYGNYVFESKNWEAEIGLRFEHVNIQYNVNPDHNTYKSDGYHYTNPFPNTRLSYKFNEGNKISLFFNRRVDRPNEVDIRIFPKYDDAEIIKVGNPALRPQFTNSVEFGYKNSWQNGSFYTAIYHRFADGTITRISTIVPGSTLVYAVFQNAGKSYNTGLEAIWHQKISRGYTCTINGNLYRNKINAFTINNLYPQPTVYTANEQKVISGNVKLNNSFRTENGWEAQIIFIYLAADVIPQGTIDARFSVDAGVKKTIQKGKGELFFNATDIFNTMLISKKIRGNGFSYTSKDYYETQVIRLGYSYKF